MKLIADSGSTKTDWRIITSDNQIKKFSTIGLSPFFVDSIIVKQEIENNFPCYINPSEVENVYFFGTGCSSESRINIIADALKYFFPNAHILVNSDLHGAAMALLGDTSGIASILGTGSNTCFWDGKNIAKSIPSLGYILGDEGSAAHIGKTFITNYLSNNVPSELEKKFEIKYKLTRSEILERLYKGNYPNVFLAQFSTFLSENINHPYIVYVVSNCFLSFFEKQIHQIPNFSEYKLCCVGSVAYYFKDILEECALISNIEIDKIVQKPINELTKFYLYQKT